MKIANVTFQRPTLYPKQQAAIFAPTRYSIIEASTKSGKTFGCMVWLLEQLMAGKAGQNFWWVAPIFTQASMVFTRYKQSFRDQKLPTWLWTAHEGKLMIEFGGRFLWFKSADNPDSLFGEDVYAAVIDEATRCKDEAWFAVRSTLTATQGPVRIIGNVKGKQNWAYVLARRAESGEPNMTYAKIRAYDAVEAGVLSSADIEDARRQLPEHVFRELYEAEPSDDEGCPFRGIEHCVEPISQADPVVWGWDLGKSIDWTVGIALDTDGRVCRFVRWQQVPWPETIERIVSLTLRTPALIDSTGLGDPVFALVQKAATKLSGRFEGFKFTPATKQQLMEGLAVAIEQRAIRFPEGPIVQELKTFMYEYTRTGARYTAPEGLHDDCVCALALAVQMKGAKRASWALL